jgi:hypothetical protein
VVSSSLRLFAIIFGSGFVLFVVVVVVLVFDFSYFRLGFSLSFLYPY